LEDARGATVAVGDQRINLDHLRTGELSYPPEKLIFPENCHRADPRQPRLMSKRSPAEILRRVRRLSAVNGWSVTVVAGFSILLSAAAFGGLLGVGVGGLVLVGGLVELRGRTLLGRRDPEGLRWLVRAQVIVLGAVLTYAVSRLASFDAELALSNETPEMRALLTEAGLEAQDLGPLIRLVFYLLYGAVAVGTLIYQGGLALYYRSCRAAVHSALTNPERPPITPR